MATAVRPIIAADATAISFLFMAVSSFFPRFSQGALRTGIYQMTPELA